MFVAVFTLKLPPISAAMRLMLSTRCGACAPAAVTAASAAVRVSRVSFGEGLLLPAPVTAQEGFSGLLLVPAVDLGVAAVPLAAEGVPAEGLVRLAAGSSFCCSRNSCVHGEDAA